MEILKIVLFVIQSLLLAYLLAATLYFAVFSVAGLFPLRKGAKKDDRKRMFAVLIPGYKEDAVIVEVARQALVQDYPADRFEVVVIADSFAPSTMEALRQLPIRLIEVTFEKSSKARALNFAMAQLPDHYDAVVILDADNIMAPDFITRMNDALSTGFSAVQGHRQAKNKNTSFAVLDSVSEEINNHIFRKGHRVLGLSSALIGSGMAFDYRLFKDYMFTIDSFGEDKELEIKLLKNRFRIEYCDDAAVYDEKVQKSKVFLVQRTRWLANQLIYARSYFLTSLGQLFFKGNVDFFDKVFQQFLPPRIFLLGFLVIFSVISAVVNPLAWTLAWVSVTLVCIFTLMISIPGPYFNMGTLKAMLLLPKGFVFMLGSLFRIFKAKQGFGHTTHGVTTGDQKHPQ
jgi:cellulose synthase/poly-beta-1,6-N-acetylglucosamine synthase-like glycosyltransferase